MTQFPEKLPFVHSQASHRRTLGRKSAVAEILALDEQGQRRTQFDPLAVQFGLYVWNDGEWRLQGVFASRREARKAADQARRRAT